MRVLVTGADGFVGREVVGLLRAAQHEVVEFKHAAGQDITKPETIAPAMNGVQAVIHLAAVLGEESRELWGVNVGGTKNVLEAAVQERVGQFIFVSSVGVMGDVKGLVDESAPYNPKTRYERSKADAEKLVLSYQEAVPVTVVRSSFVYGAKTYWAEIARAVQKRTPLVGRGENTWQMVYVKDLADAIVFLLGRDEAIGGVFIVAGDDKPKLREVYEGIAKLLGVKPAEKRVAPWMAKIAVRIARLRGKKTLLTPALIDRLQRERNYSTEKIKALGWKPRYALGRGLGEMVAELKGSGEL